MAAAAAAALRPSFSVIVSLLLLVAGVERALLAVVEARDYQVTRIFPAGGAATVGAATVLSSSNHPVVRDSPSVGMGVQVVNAPDMMDITHFRVVAVPGIEVVCMGLDIMRQGEKGEARTSIPTLRYSSLSLTLARQGVVGLVCCSVSHFRQRRLLP
jgi:hypothetical protein